MTKHSIVRTTGHSLHITVPAKFVRKNGISVGDFVVWDQDAQNPDTMTLRFIKEKRTEEAQEEAMAGE